MRRLDVPGQWEHVVPPWLTSLLVGAVMCALAIGLRAAFQLIWPTTIPFGFLFPMILLATLIGRLLGGLTCFVLGGALIWNVVAPQVAASGLSGYNRAAVPVLYVLTGGTLLLIAAGYRAAQQAVQREQMLRAEAEADHQRLLAQELSHRIKNLLTTVQAIAAQTLDGDGTELGHRRAFQDRLAALGRAHDVLIGAGWKTASLHDIVTASVEAFGDGTKFRIAGPEVQLPPRVGIAVALALHELATNAVKYGALSSGIGSVGISWEIDAQQLRVRWTEQDGPKIGPPTRTGFGTRLLQRNLARELGGRIQLDYAPDGLRCEIEAPCPGTTVP